MAASLKLSELTALTAVDDADLLLVTDSSATQSKKVTFSDFKTSLTSGLSVDDLRSAVGTTLGSGHMGTFTGSLIGDNTSVKAALQALETATELRATAASPQFTGNLATLIGGATSPVVHRIQGGFPDVILRTNGGDVDLNQNEGRLLWEDAGGGAVGAIKMTMLPAAPMRFFTKNITAAEEKMRITTDGRVGIGKTVPLAKLHVGGSVIVEADFPDFDLRSGGERRIIFQDAGGGAEAAIKSNGANLDIFVGGVGASNEIVSFDADSVDFKQTVVIEDGITLGGTTITAWTDLTDDFDIDHIHDLTGIAAGTGHLGTFTGSTIADSTTIKAALQALETSTETKFSAAGGTLTGNFDVAKSFPDITLKAGDERRILFSDAGGSAEGGFKFASNTLKVFAGGIASGNEIIRIDSDSVDFKQTIVAEDGFTMDSVALTTIQTSGESFADNDTSLMTSAAINDRIAAVGGGGVDANNGTHTGTTVMAEIDLSGDIDVDGTANLDAVDIDGDVDLAGDLTFSAAKDIQIIDNDANALEIAEAGNNYVVFDTTNSAERVELGVDVTLESERLYFTHTAPLIRLPDNKAAALTIENHDGSAGEFVVFTTSNSGLALTTKQAHQHNNTLTVGEDDTGYDVKLFGATASAYLLWDESADDLILAGDAGLVVPEGQFTLGSTAVTSTAAELNLVDGITAGTVTASKALIVDSNKDLTGLRNLTLTGDLTVQGTQTVVDTVTMQAANAIVFEGATADDHETTLTIIDPDGDRTVKIPNQSGCLPVLAADSNTQISATPEEINVLDGVTAGTVSAGLAVVVDSNKDVTGFRNVTLSGWLIAAVLDISGNVDIDGITNLDVVDIDGATQIDGTVTVGVDDTGYDVKFFGATSGAYMLWDESEDDLVLAGAAGLDIAGDIDVDGTTNLDAVDIDGAVQADGTVTVGVDDTGYDVKFFGATSGAYMLWDESEDDLVLAGAAGLDIAGDIDVDGTTNLDAVDIDGATQIDGTVTVGVDDTGYDVKFFGATSGASLLWDESADDLILAGAAGLIVPEGQFTLGSTAVTSTAAEINVLDGVTAGTVAASKAVVVDSNKDAASFRNVTLTGELDAATLDISGDADIDGTTNLDAVDIDGATQIDATVTVGVDDTGYDVKFFGATSGAYMLWDESEDDLVLAGAAGLDIAGNIDVDGTTNLDAVDIDGATQIDATVTVGVDDTGYDVKFFGATASAFLLWDESADDLILSGAAGLVVPEGQFTLGSTAVTSTAAELNLVDGITAGTVSASKAVIVDSDKDVTGFRNVTATGEVDCATLDVSSTSAFADNVTIENQKEIRFAEGSGNGSNYTGFRAPAALTANVTFTLPDGDGSNGQVITTNGSGTLAWSDAPTPSEFSGVTAGTVSASKGVEVDSNKDITGFRNVTLTGELDTATLDVSGDADIDGTTNLDAVDIDGATQIDATVTVGVDDTGYDVKFFGATSGAYMLWDESEDDLVLAGAAGLDIAGDIDVDGTANLDNVDIDGNTNMGGNLTFSGGATNMVLTDNSTGALDIKEGTTSYMKFDTTNGSELITVAKGTNFTGAVDIDSDVDLAGDLTFSAAKDIQLVDNNAAALEIAEAGNNYMTFVTTNSSEAVVINQNLTFNKGSLQSLNSTANRVTWTIIDNDASSLMIAAGGTGIVKFDTQDDAETIFVYENVVLDSGATFGFDDFSSAKVDRIQASGSSFADNDTSLMTSASIQDKIQADTSKAGGTWTATLEGAGGAPGSKVTATGDYARMGDIVLASVHFNNVDTSSYSGAISISGLPVTSKNTATATFMGQVYNNGMISGATDSIQALVADNGTTISFLENANGSALDWGTVGSGKSMRVQVQYIAA